MTTQTLPALVRDVELTRPLPAIAATGSDGRRVERAWILVRLCTEPVGSVLIGVPESGLGPAELVAAIEAELGGAVRAAISAAGGDPAAGIPHGGVAVPDLPPFLAERAKVLRSAPAITAVICTRERPDALRECLDSLLSQVYPALRILVVDNAPTTDATERVVRAAAARGDVDYLVEPAPGLSRARNRAVAARPGEILAWIDDDEVADPYWIAEVARALARHPEADVVSGVIVPAELETPAQLWFEQFGGHSKGRGFVPAIFSPATADVQSPLYPLPPFATGANMTFRPGVLERIGGFDAALGAGTPAMGSEDTLAFTKVLYGGGTIVYQPSAITRHYHRRDLAGLRRQMVGYGRGLTAAYTSLVLADPRVLLPLVRLVPTAMRDVFGTGGLRTATVQSDFPEALLKLNRRAMATGPFAYLWGRLRGPRQAQLAGGRA